MRRNQTVRRKRAEEAQTVTIWKLNGTIVLLDGRHTGRIPSVPRR